LEPYTYLPEGPRGNYFERSREGVQRWQFMTNVFWQSRHWFGTHDLQAGFKADQIHLDRDAERTSIRILDSAYALTRESLFRGSGCSSHAFCSAWRRLADAELHNRDSRLGAAASRTHADAGELDPSQSAPWLCVRKCIPGMV